MILITAFTIFLGGCSSSNPEGPSKEHKEHAGESQVEVQSHVGYKLILTSEASGIKTGQPTLLSYKIQNTDGEILKDFETVHEKIMHFIVVRHDLQEFQHLHPKFDISSGEFSVDLVFPRDGKYRIFPDFTPGESINPMALPVTIFEDIEIGTTKNEMAIKPDEKNIKTVDGYEIEFEAPEKIEANESVTYSINVSKKGQPINDLENYLGALGHSVILKTEDLDFIHTHALEGNAMGPKIDFSTTFPEAGLYKIFIQFQHDGKVLTTDQVVSVARSSGENKANLEEHHMNH